jgi:protein TonB
MSTPLQDNPSEVTASSGMKVALIGPNEAHRKIVAKALAGSEARSVREFVDYPANLADLPNLLEQNYDVIMIDVDSDQSYALKLVETVAGLTSAAVMVYSKRNDPDLLMNCMRAGARDFLPLPEEPQAEAPATGPGPQLVQPESRPLPPSAPNSSVPSEPRQPLQPESRPVPRAAQSFGAPPTSMEPPDYAPTIDSGMPEPEPAPELEQEMDAFPVHASSAGGDQPHSLQQDIDEWDEAHLRAPEPAMVREPAPQFSISPEPRTFKAPEPVEESALPIESFLKAPEAPPRETIESTRIASVPQPAQASEAAQAPSSFDEWDSAFLRTPQTPGNKGVGTSPRATVTSIPRPQQIPDPRAPEPAPRQVSTADLFAASVEADTSLTLPDTSVLSAARPRIDRASIPLFQYEVPEEEKRPDHKWVLWVSLAAGLGIVACILVIVFANPFRHGNAAPAPQPQPVAAAQDQTPPAWQPVAATDRPSAKPSAAIPITSAETTVAAPAPTAQVSSRMMDAQLAAPSRISTSVKTSDEDAPPSGFTPATIDNGGSNVPGSVFGGPRKVEILPGVHAISSGVAEGMLVRKIDPVYPRFAKDSRISGTVVLKATITKTGSIEGLQVASGPQVLGEAAVNAVRYWRYRPYMLNGQPVDVQTTINVVFKLDN